MITEDYVSFEIAKLLKEKGFDEPTIGSYTLTDKITYIGTFTEEEVRRNWNKGYHDAFVSAPTHQMALKWLREVHNLYVVITHKFSCNADDDITYNYDIWTHPDKYTVNHNYCDGGFMSNEEAIEAALEYALTNLI